MLTTSHPLVGEARIAALIHAYLVADYRWELDGVWRNLHVGQPAPDVEAWRPQIERFGLLSAWDPHSIPRPEEVNRAADENLHRDLKLSGLPLRAAFSSAANRTWREPSWLVAGMAFSDLDALSWSYGHLATLAWERGQPIRLRVRERQEEHPVHDAEHPGRRTDA